MQRGISTILEYSWSENAFRTIYIYIYISSMSIGRTTLADKKFPMPIHSDPIWCEFHHSIS